MNCQSCGAALGAGPPVCVRCGSPVARDAGSTGGFPPPSAMTPTVPPMASGMPTNRLGDSTVQLAHGEVIKKTFDIGGVTKGMGWLKGELIVTDARVIYRAHAKNTFGESRNCRELQIQDVNGVALITRRGLTPLSLLSILLGLLLGLLLIPILQWLLTMVLGTFLYRMGVYDLGGLGILAFMIFVTIAAVMITIRARSTEVVFALFARSVEASPIGLAGANGRQNPGVMAITVASFGRPMLGLLRWLGVMDASDASDSADLAQTQQMYDEIGALILDIQSRGVFSTND